MDAVSSKSSSHSHTTHDNLPRDMEKDSQSAAPRSQQPYSLSFFDAGLAPFRKIYLGILGKVTMAIILLIWTVVPIYWGSLWKQTAHSGNLTAWVIDRDNSTIGQAISSALVQSNSHAVPHLAWHSISPASYPTAQDVEQAIAVDHKAWIAVEISEGATSKLAAARASGDSTYSPSSVMTLVYSEARSQTAVDGLVLGSTRAVLAAVIPSLASSMAAQYLSSISGNSTALSTLANAPQTIANPIAYATSNLRPYDLPVAIAPTFVGLIYLLILAFNVTMAGMAARAIIAPRLRLSSYMAVRVLIPMVLYFFISLFFSLVNIAFKVHFEKFNGSYGAGFMMFWMASYIGMCVLGLTTEVAITLVGPQFIGFFLVVYIIINVSVANIPFELQDRIFYYGYAMPFNAVKVVYLAAIFNVGSRADIGRSFGILLAWLVLLFVLVPVVTWRERRNTQKQQNDKAAEENQSESQQ